MSDSLILFAPHHRGLEHGYVERPDGSEGIRTERGVKEAYRPAENIAERGAFLAVNVLVVVQEAGQELDHRLLIGSAVFKHGEESENQLSVLHSIVLYSEYSAPCGSAIQLLQHVDERPAIDGCPYLLRCKLSSAGVQSLEDVVDACVAVGRAILPDHGGVQNAVLEIDSVLFLQRLVCFVFVPILNFSLKWTRLSRQKIIEFLVCVKKNSDYLMLTFSAFSPEYTSQGVR